MVRRADPHPGLPADPDEPGPAGRPGQPGRPGSGAGGRPLHLQPGALGVVLIGGALGALARYAIALARPTPADGWPWDTFATNLLGAFTLGALLEILARGGPDTGLRRVVRLGAGTGFLGAFTTYSTLAVETDLLVRDHHTELGVAYLVTSAAAGIAVAWAGIAVAAAVDARRRGTGGQRPGRRPVRAGRPE